MTEPYDSCPTCKTRHPKGWACPYELAATQREVERLKADRCVHCGADLIDDCLRCGAPQCCPKCCQIADIEARLAAAEEGWLEARDVIVHWERQSDQFERERDEARGVTEDIAYLVRMRSTYSKYADVFRQIETLLATDEGRGDGSS